VERAGTRPRRAARQPEHNDASVAFTHAGNRALIAWENDKLGVRARFVRLDGADGGAEMALATNTAIPPLPFNGELTLHRHASVVFLAGGDFLLAWTEERSLVSIDIFFDQRQILDQDVYLQRFNIDGTPASARTRVNVAADGFQRRPTLALREGGAVVVWESVDNVAGNTGDGIFARLISAAGVPVGGQIRVSTISQGHLASGAAVATAGNSFAVTWEGPDTGTKGVYLRIFNPAGAGGPLIRVNDQVAGLQRRAGVAAAADGEWLVVYQGQVGPRTNARIFGQFFSATGVAIGNNFQVSNDDYLVRISPSVARLSDGTYLVAWLDYVKTFPVGPTAVVIDGAGNVVGDEIDLNLRPVDAHHRLGIAVNGNDDALVAWEGFAVGQQRAGIQARVLRTE
jgi:hypothetical protein